MLSLDQFCAQYVDSFISEKDSNAIFEWILSHVEGLDYEDIEMGDGSVFRLSVGKCMFVDEPLLSEDLLSKRHGRRQHWPDILLSVKQKIETLTGLDFSVCVCIYYRDGSESMGFHYDPPAFGPTNVIASLSLGQAREFCFRDKHDHTEQYSLMLNNGSLLVMGEGCQENSEHALPISTNYNDPRINLTFRQFSWPNE